jgi:nucleoside-diphosphate-sugar epimerase
MILLKNLVIGNSAQLARYFPIDYLKISSRNIPSSIFDENWNVVYIVFAEQRTFNSNCDDFLHINFNYTLEVINKLKANKIIFYSTAELWNNFSGAIDASFEYNFKRSDYLESKFKISEFLKNSYNNVKIVYPFNFNSVYRNSPFLFGKIFDSIINKKKILIGDTYFYRDITHPKFIVDNSIDIKTDTVLGSGRLIFVNDFIRSLYKSFNMDFNFYVKEDLSVKSIYRNSLFYSNQDVVFNENDLLYLSCKEINQILNKN